VRPEVLEQLDRPGFQAVADSLASQVRMALPASPVQPVYRDGLDNLEMRASVDFRARQDHPDPQGRPVPLETWVLPGPRVCVDLVVRRETREPEVIPVRREVVDW